MELTPAQLFLLGNAYGSFSYGDIDQGIDILLPTTDGYNEVFKDLCEGYFIPIKDAPHTAYMGAIEKWCLDNDIKIDHQHYLHIFAKYTG
jgi:hypothetical protein